MPGLEFYTYLLGNVYEFIFINALIFLFFFSLFKKTLVGGVFDPFFLVFIVGFSTNYAVVVFLYVNGFVSNTLFIMNLFYVFIFILGIIFFSKTRVVGTFGYIVNLITSSSSGRYEFITISFLYFLISSYLLSQVGFGFFAESNRFENARGFGAFVRLLDLFSVFIVAYATLLIFYCKSKVSKIFYSFILLLFILFSSLINGAKISVIFSLITVIFVLRVEGYASKVSLKKMMVFVILGLSFMLFALQVNLKNNNVNMSEESKFIPGLPFVVDRFIHRIVANGNTSYLLLPNDVIHKISTDNLAVRLMTPIIGITQMSRIVGYNANDYSVGRQALLYYHEGVEVSGGPTSHFDLFSYVYLGLWGGGGFVLFLSFLLGGINFQIRRQRFRRSSNIYVSALLTTFWVRGVIIVVEPTVGMAYLVDLLIVFLSLAIFWHVVRCSNIRRIYMATGSNNE